MMTSYSIYTQCVPERFSLDMGVNCSFDKTDTFKEFRIQWSPCGLHIHIYIAIHFPLTSFLFSFSRVTLGLHDGTSCTIGRLIG